MTILEHEIMMTEQLRRVPADELQARLNKFRAVMDREFPGRRTRFYGSGAVMNVPAMNRCCRISVR